MKAVTKLGIRCEKTTNNPNGWKEVSPNDFSFSQPLVICLPGDGTTSARAANAMAKNAEQMLGMVGLKDHEKDVQIAAVYYDNAEDNELSDSRQYFLESNGLKRKSAKEFSNEAKNPPYIHQFYQDYLKPAISTPEENRLTSEQAMKNMRKINILAHCHGSFFASKLEEIIKEDMSRLGYEPKESKEILSQLAVISISPRANFEKSQASQIAFAALDDYHFYDSNVVAVKNAYNLADENVLESTTGVFSMPGPFIDTKSDTAQLYAVDKMLKFNSEEAAFKANLGHGTEALHTIDAYINPEYSCDLGHKSQVGKNFSQMIAKSLQNAVSNSCDNYQSQDFSKISKQSLLADRKASYKQGNSAQNQNFLDLEIGKIVKNAHETGEVMERKIFLQTIRNIVKGQGIKKFDDPNLTAMVILDAKMHNLDCDLKIEKNEREKVDPKILSCIDRLESANTTLTDAFIKRSIAKKYTEMSGLEVDTSLWNQTYNNPNHTPKIIETSARKFKPTEIDKNTLRVSFSELGNKSH